MNKNFRRGMSKFLGMALALSLVIGNTPRANALEGNTSSYDQETLQSIKAQIYSSKVKNREDVKTEDPEEIIRVVVELEGKSAAESMPEGVRATPQAIGAVKENQGAAKSAASSLDGASIRHSYGNVINGFSMDVKRKEVDKLKEIPGVKKVKEANKYETDMNYAKNLTQAFDAWKKYNLKGEGMLVSVIDTGIDYTHKDLKAPKDISKIKLSKDKVEELKKTGALKSDLNAETYFNDKIPFGYNYADKNNDIVDKRPDGGHGIHVAGIVAADGDEEEVKNGQAIQGVAPQAQLLGMKAFSNGPAGKYAYTDDIVAALEDSVTLGADIINMSLGSAAGFQDDDDAEQKAIKNAADKGVLVVVSAGNSSYSTAPYRDSTMKDISVVGSPALAKDAFMVANYQNQKVTAYSATFNLESEEINGTFSTHQVSFEEKKDYEIINCGFGKPEDFEGKNLKNKVALISRGELDFIAKILNAQNAGAIGVVVYNHASGGEALINMATDGNIKIPAIFVGNNAGSKAASALDNKEKVTLKLTGATITQDNPSVDDYDDSTSWGPAPNLDFKPQIAGPGGNIFSTVNGDRYDNMSGTSMAAPHVAGGMALIMQAIKGYNSNLQGRELIDYAKNVAMNTSNVKIDKFNEGVPFSPRRQGAGLIQIEDAIKNKVTATYNGKASVALKEIKEKEVSFQIDLNNYGDKDVTYSIENLKGVLSQADKDANGEMAHDIILDSKDAKISFDQKEITVKANSNSKINVTLTIGNGLSTERFLEGYLKFNSKTEEAPSLVIPFMGYYGDWSKENIINHGEWEEAETVMAEINNGALRSGLVSKYGEEMDTMGDDIEKYAISPDGDGYGDAVIPYLYFLRNAKKVSVDIKDKDKNIITNVNEEENVRKNIYNTSNGSGKKPKLFNSLAWDGTVYDNLSGKNEAVEEGQYYISIKSYVDIEGKEPQIMEIPIKVDLTAPEVKIISKQRLGDRLVVKWRAKDNLSGIATNNIVVDGKVVEDAKVYYDKYSKIYSTSIDVKETEAYNVSLAVLDGAGNMTVEDILVTAKEAVIDFENKLFAGANMELTEKGLDHNGNFLINGNLSAPLKVFKINDKDVKVNEDLSFEFVVEAKELKQGINYVKVYAEDLNGKIAKVLQEDKSLYDANNYSVKIYLDSEAPVINVEAPVVDEEGVAYTDNGEILIKGSVSDSCMGYKFYINGKLIKSISNEVDYGHEFNLYNFEKTIKVENGEFIQLKAVDTFGHETIKTIKVVYK
ncbi:S8 family serine peptidase [Clostridium amazonitimonense]|uniref:S8 family serine peptidase n=1 Tax=Clostridium amazonitimonense TaxID=1499689 RepID=UPI000689E028|nr:S8 family serine peptidase [Clostridium amazonitimonense]